MMSASWPSASGPVGDIDQVGGDHGGGAQHRERWQAPLHQRDKLVGVLAVRNGGGVGADRDFDAGLVGGQDRGPRFREHLGRFGLQFRGSVRDVHALRQIPCRHQERAALDHQRDRLVIDQEPVLDAVDARLDRVDHRLGAVRVRGDPHPTPMRLVDDRPQFLIRIVLRPGGPVNDITPPEQQTLISWAPCLI